MEFASSDVERQRRYYAGTAHLYDSMHLNKKDEHFLALSFLISSFEYLGIKSVLDIGAGTGRALQYIKEHRPDVMLRGVEPVEELRKVGHEKGLAEDELIYGDGMNLHFEREQFDLVCEFGMLHHVKRPEKVVAEMIRVAKKAIFISDCNNFGQGPVTIRTIKQMLNHLGLWRIADFIKTRGKGYCISEGDGIAYSYSVFNNFKQIKKSCKQIHMLNTKNAGPDLYKTASHIALLAIKN